MSFDGRLKEFETLGPNWDGYKALPPTDAAIHSASCMTPVPMNDGGIQLEMHLNGGSVEIEIMPDGSLGPVMYVPNSTNQPR
tara:strand:- start:56 stop:301 length:246 start_codon:yes stop_codon:yes gene_type:complete